MVFWESLFWCKSLELALAEWKKFINLYKSMANHLIFSTVDTYTLGSGHEFLHFFQTQNQLPTLSQGLPGWVARCAVLTCAVSAGSPSTGSRDATQQFLRFPGHVTDQMPSNQPANRGGLSGLHKKKNDPTFH